MKDCVKIALASVLIFIMVACSAPPPKLRGFYQSEMIAGEVVQITIFDDENRFIEYITNREVNSGTYTLEGDGSYQFDGNEYDFNILLSDDNSFEVMLPKLDETQPILMKNLSDVPATFSTEWDDVEEYKDFIR